MNYSKIHKMRELRTGRIVSNETKKKISDALKRATGHVTGKAHKLKTRENISKAQKGRSRCKRLYKEEGSWTMIKVNI